MGKTIQVSDEDHKQFKIVAATLDMPMNELFHKMVERYSETVFSNDR